MFQGLQLLVMKNGTPTAFQDTLRPVFKIARYNSCCYTTCMLKKIHKQLTAMFILLKQSG
jgi:hypothetical protein